MPIPSDLPSRTLTFLFTDLEGSTRLWEQHPQAMKSALERHDALLRLAVESSNGQVVKTTGDGLMAIFASSLDGIRACLAAQCAFVDEPWGETGPLRVRMGLHIGEVQPRAGDFYGPAVNRGARLMSAAHGGQVLLSAAVASLLADLLPDGVTLRDLGEHRLKDLARPEHVFQLIHPDLQADFPPLATLDRHPNNLPAQPTPLIGREAELTEILKRLDTEGVRLLTLTGPGGIGKTRLALQAAADMIDRFQDGVFFVDLAPIRDPDRVPIAIGQALGLRGTTDRPMLDEIKAHLLTRHILLLLDNFEQVTPAASQVVELLRECPHLKLLVTSREALRVRDEYIFPVPPLDLPGAGSKLPSLEQLTQYEAVRLFIERAQAVKPDFQVTNENAPAVAEICVRLDGLPLAIELAAARIRLFSPQALLERLGSRLSLLRGGARDLPARQKTLRNAVDWSYELLDPGEQWLFKLLSVFTGGSSFQAVEAVAQEAGRLEETGIDILDGLASLVDKSLLRQIDQASGDPRFMMLETIREYATDRLGEDPDLAAGARRAHAVYFAGFTQDQWERLAGPEREAALVEISADIENIRSAWRYWVDAKDLEELDRFANTLWLFNDVRGWYQATIDFTRDLLTVLSSTPPEPGRIVKEIVLQTRLARALLAVKGYTGEVEQAYTRALDLAGGVGDLPQLFPVLRGLASIYVYLGKFDKAAQMAEKILELSERLEDAGMRVEGLLILGYNTAFLGDINRGLDTLDESISGYDPRQAHARELSLGNDPGVVGLAVSSLLLWMHGFPDRSLERSKAAITLAKKLDLPFTQAYALFHAGVLYLFRQDLKCVEELTQAALSLAEEHDFQVWSAVATCLHGAALVGMGQAEQGMDQVLRGIRLYQSLYTPPGFLPILLSIEAQAHAQVGDPGQALTVLDKALEIVDPYGDSFNAAEFYRIKGDLLQLLPGKRESEAETCYLKSRDVARSLRLLMLELRAAIRLCRLWQAQGKAMEGKQLLGEVYAQFTEGFGEVDLVEARAILEQ